MGGDKGNEMQQSLILQGTCGLGGVRLSTFLTYTTKPHDDNVSVPAGRAGAAADIKTSDSYRRYET